MRKFSASIWFIAIKFCSIILLIAIKSRNRQKVVMCSPWQSSQKIRIWMRNSRDSLRLKLKRWIRVRIISGGIRSTKYQDVTYPSIQLVKVKTLAPLMVPLDEFGQKVIKSLAWSQQRLRRLGYMHWLESVAIWCKVKRPNSSWFSFRRIHDYIVICMPAIPEIHNTILGHTSNTDKI